MNAVKKILTETSVILCYCHIGKNVRVKCIIDCRVKAKPEDVNVHGKEVKEVKEEKASDVVNNIMKAWDNVVKSSTKGSCVQVW